MAEPMFGGKRPMFGGKPTDIEPTTSTGVPGGSEAPPGYTPSTSNGIPSGSEAPDGYIPEKGVAKEPPKWSFEGTPMETGLPPLAQDAIGGVYSGGRNVAETALAIRDKITGGDDAKSFHENVPEYETPKEKQGLVSDIVRTGAEIVTGGGPAMKLGSELFKTVKILPTLTKAEGRMAKYMKNGLKTLMGEAGAAAAVSDTGTLFTGDEAAFTQLWEGVGKDDTGKFSDEILQKRLNLLAEAILVVKGAEIGTRTATSVGKIAKDWIVKPLLNLGKESEREKAIVKDLLGMLVEINPDDTSQKVAQKYNQIINHIENNKEVLFPSGFDELDDVMLKKDTMTALADGTDDPLLHAKAGGLRAGVEGRGSAELETAIAQPSLVTEKHLDDVKRVSGGDEAIETARGDIQQGAFDESDAMLDEITTMENKLISNEADVATLVQNDPVFGEELKKLGKAANIDLGLSRTRATANDIIKDIQKASDTMTAKKNELFDAISDDALIDYESLTDAIDDAGVDETLAEAITEASGNYKKLHNFATGELNDEIGYAVNAKDFKTATKLRELKHHILQDQLEFIAENGDEATASAAKEAMDYYTKEYAPFWRDGVLADIQYIDRTRKMQPLDKAVESRSALEGSLNNPDKAEYTQSVIDLLNTEAGGKNAPKALDYVFSKIAEEVQPILNTKGKLDPEDISKFTNKLGAYIPILEKVDPSQVKRINQFMTDLRDKSFTTKELKENIEALKQNHKQLEQELFGGKLKDFFDSDTDSLKPKENTKEIFQSVFNKKEVVRDLPEIIKRAGPENLKGLRAAYSDVLSTKVFRDQKGLAGESLTAPVDKKTLEELYKAGDLLFKDKPEVMTAIRGLVEEVQGARGGTIRRLPTPDTGSFRKRASGAVDFLITQTFGVLNRVGARIRSGAGKALGTLDPAQNAKFIMDKVLSNPDEFTRIAKLVSQEEASKQRLSPTTRKTVIKWLAGSSIYGPIKENDFDPSLDEQTNANLNQEKSVSGRPVYKDKNGDSYSEKTVTFSIGDKWYTFPSVDKDGKEMTEDQVTEYVKEKGPIDPITGEKFPTFKSVDEAVDYAKKRSSTRLK